MSETILFRVDAGIAVITLNRPEVRNAIDLATARQLSKAIDEVDSRADIRVAVLASSHDGVFSAGMDLKAFSLTGERPIDPKRGAFGLVGRPPQKPLIGAVEGKALGGGLELLLACDLIVGAATAEFGLPEVRRGLVAAGGGVLRLPRRIPRAIALELVLTGDPIDARRAYELGLVNRLVPAGCALTTALDIAATIAANAPLAVRIAKQLVEESTQWPMAEAFDRQEPLAKIVRSSCDAAEGALAFAEKRPPVWKDR